MVAKLHSSLFANGRACGRKYRIRYTSGTNKAIHDACTGNTIVVMVIDQCKTCLANDLVLSQEAFAKIARPNLGRVNIAYQQYELSIIELILLFEVYIFVCQLTNLLIGIFYGGFQDLIMQNMKHPVMCFSTKCFSTKRRTNE
ncbi:putative rlpA-like protein, double-psi beta-barrel [Helianthus annuus]|uniref:RlpA-like protein, double-psi beta-barrel n=2 Tax=Helianthus annuus TaxID=4232 RepID=A0A9K3I423_HELAN|nr:putative rlpA-like protein, double-psi beta-barrel [Helianthus annuus]KAJ0532783.1 putative rlpA-like protein, double-psi beta-barrel [Helianthus annuus]KAJ0710342.1 putative EG45-like domain containing protein, plant [Helianthus annuus]KAJ0891769.1 putative rlpA-like protein, double-psi beta-barrel [Helianthus annuus]